MTFLQVALFVLTLGSVHGQGPQRPPRPSVGVGNQAATTVKNIDIIAAIHKFPRCVDVDDRCDAFAKEVAEDVYVDQDQWPEILAQGETFAGAMAFASAYLACLGYSEALGEAYLFLHAHGTFTVDKRVPNAGAHRIGLKTDMTQATLTVASSYAVQEAATATDSIIAEAWVNSDFDYCEGNFPWTPFNPWLCSHSEAYSISLGSATAEAWGSAFSEGMAGSESAQATEVHVEAWNIKEFTASVVSGIRGFSYTLAKADAYSFVETFSIMESETFQEQCRAVCAKNWDGAWDVEVFCEYAYAYAFANAVAYAEAYGGVAAEVFASLSIDWKFEAEYKNEVGPGDSIVFGPHTSGGAGLALRCNTK